MITRFAPLSVLFLAVVASAGEPVSGPSRSGNADRADTVPVLSVPTSPGAFRASEGPLQVRQLRPDPLRHTGGAYIDAREGSPGPLTPLEVAKLSIARQRVAAAFAAGRLPLPMDSAPAPTARSAETAARAPESLPECREAGIGTDLPSVQESGSGLTARELEKVTAGPITSTDVEPPQ